MIEKMLNTTPSSPQNEKVSTQTMQGTVMENPGTDLQESSFADTLLSVLRKLKELTKAGLEQNWSASETALDVVHEDHENTPQQISVGLQRMGKFTKNDVNGNLKAIEETGIAKIPIEFELAGVQDISEKNVISDFISISKQKQQNAEPAIPPPLHQALTDAVISNSDKDQLKGVESETQNLELHIKADSKNNPTSYLPDIRTSELQVKNNIYKPVLSDAEYVLKTEELKGFEKNRETVRINEFPNKYNTEKIAGELKLVVHNLSSSVHDATPLPVKQIQTQEAIDEFVKTINHAFKDLKPAEVGRINQTFLQTEPLPETFWAIQNPEMIQRNETDVQIVRRIQQSVRLELQSVQSSRHGWKLHNFSMFDGSRFQMGIRQLEGILQLQLSSVNQELNRLIQMHSQEIRDYLQNEMGLEVDLQFEENSFTQKGNGNLQDNKGDNSSREESVFERQSAIFLRSEQGNQAFAGTRYFGFNDNEWTA